MPWSTTLFLLRRLVDVTVARRRRDNYQALLDSLGDLVASPFGQVPAGASPFLFPVNTNDKATTLDHLRVQRVEALDVWSAGHPTLPSEGYPDAEARRARTVGLPVHQELTRRDIDQIATAVRRSIDP
jgi:dTDP-4-amino-4,6-dideoxygalactose transaminase